MLRVIFGPMFAGKSTSMIMAVERYHRARKKCVVIRHTKDDRQESPDNISTHAGHVHDTVSVELLSTLLDDRARDIFAKHDVIGIDELQFYPMLSGDNAYDIAKCLHTYAKEGKIIICSSLDSDYTRKPMEIVAPIVAYASSVEKISAVCRVCGADAPFSARLLADEDYENPVGGDDKYAALCRTCYDAGCGSSLANQ